jgi:thioredoxin-related protein
MPANLSKKIDIVANIAIIVVSILIGVVLFDRYFTHRPDRSDPRITAGTKLSLADVDWAGNGQTLLVALQKGCHFCSESAPFYQRLASETSRLNTVRLVAILPQEVNEAKGYLNDLNIPINEVKQARLSDVGVKGTPTLILVNAKGEAVESWIGKLPPEKESEVLSRLRIDGTSNKGN